MDLNSMETIDFNALGGADTITVNDLTGTGVKNVNIDLASPPGSGTGDGQADTIIINATSGDDNIVVNSDALPGSAVTLTASRQPLRPVASTRQNGSGRDGLVVGLV